MAKKTTVVVDTPVDAPAAEIDLNDEAKRLVMGGEELEYTLIPTSVAHENQTVEPTDVTVICDIRGVQYTLCKKA